MMKKHIQSGFLTFLSFSTTCALSDLAFAKQTHWYLKNQTKHIVEIECQGITKFAKLKPKLKKVIVPAQQIREHIWGSTWHNDGIGLNPANWTCEATSLDDPKNISKLEFATQWGESIEIQITREKEEMKLSKASSQASPAR